MNTDLYEGLSRVAERVAGTILSAASKHLVTALSPLIGSYFIGPVLIRETTARIKVDDLKLDAKLERQRQLAIAKAQERQLDNLSSWSTLDVTVTDADLAIMRRERELLTSAVKERNLQSALREVIIEIEHSDARDHAADLDEEFLMAWIENVEKISNTAMRRIWVRLLAQRATEDNEGLTPHSMDVGRRIHPRLARVFERVGPLAWLMGGVVEETIVGTFASGVEFEELVEIGLLREREAAKLTLGVYVASFLQRDDVKRPTHFYTLTQAGKQIFYLLSPQKFAIFGALRPPSDLTSPRRKLDRQKHLDAIVGCFEGEDALARYFAESCKTLVETRKMTLRVTGTNLRGKPQLLSAWQLRSRGKTNTTFATEDQLSDLQHPDIGRRLIDAIRPASN